MLGGFSCRGSQGDAEGGKEEGAEDGVNDVGALCLWVEGPEEEEGFEDVVEGEGGEDGQVGVGEVEERVEKEVFNEEFHNHGLRHLDGFEGAQEGVGKPGGEAVGWLDYKEAVNK